jgi:hypothetical protein
VTLSKQEADSGIPVSIRADRTDVPNLSGCHAKIVELADTLSREIFGILFCSFYLLQPRQSG